MCKTPIRIKTINPETNLPYRVPCGKCKECKTMRINDWTFRLSEEKKVNPFQYFITLTYAPGYEARTKNGFKTLSKKHLQNFMKLLRYYSEAKIKYYAAAEYGGKTERPHYHILLFTNIDVTESIHKSWTKGFIHFGKKLTNAAIRYSLKYMDKPRKSKKHDRDDRVPQFSLKSTGIGKSYIENKQIKNYHTTNITNNNTVRIDNFRILLPRYYRKQIYTEEQKKIIATHADIFQITKEQKFNEKLKKIFKNDIQAIKNYLASHQYTEETKIVQKDNL